MTRIMMLTVLLLGIFAFSALAENEGRIYGKIYTVDGDEFEGLIRWDKNEGSWVDILNGDKERENRRRGKRSSSRRKYRDRDDYGETSIRLFGLKIGGKTNYLDGSSRQSGICFGHIKSIEPIGNDEAILVLKNGKEIEFSGGSTDIGDGIREIVIEDEREGELELTWDDIDLIEFSQSKTSEESNFGPRLYGTLTTRRGDSFTGYVCWDTDEIFERDILDGDERSRSRRIKFGKIKTIERYSSSGATIILKSGDEMVLKGSNDVNSGIRGVGILDPNLGMVTVDWDEFERLDFEELPSRTVKYDQYDGGTLLYGTVFTDDGDSYTGQIRWDDDEEYSWEILDGSFRGITFDIEFSNVKTITRRSSRGAIVTLHDNREFKLRDSNDIDDDNNGIIITTDDGEEIDIDWYDFDRVEFKK